MDIMLRVFLVFAIIQKEGRYQLFILVMNFQRDFRFRFLQK